MDHDLLAYRLFFRKRTAAIMSVSLFKPLPETLQLKKSNTALKGILNFIPQTKLLYSMNNNIVLRREIQHYLY